MHAPRRAWRLALLFAVLLPGPAASEPTRVSEVRVWDAPESTRVVLELSGAVDYKVFALNNPPRVVMDLAGAQRPTQADYAAGAESPVAAIRYGTPVAGTTRVVLDLRRAQHYEGFLLAPNERYGHRLVVDLYAESPEVRMAQARPPAAPAAQPIVVPPVAAAVVPQGAGTGLNRGVAGEQASPGSAVSALPTPIAEKPVPIERPRAARAPLAAPLVIVIDAGHGGEDPGAIGKSGTREKDVVLAIAQALARRVDAEPGMRAVLTRKGDYFLPLRSRVVAAHRADADLFVSIHADAAINRKARGSGVYALSARGASSEAARLLAAKENAADAIGGVAVAETDDPLLRSVLLDLSQNATNESSLRLAQDLLGSVRAVNTVHQSRVQQAGFVVLKSPHVPSVLVETAFISNPDEERKLRDPAFHSRLATALLAGIKAHVRADPRLATQLAHARGEVDTTGGVQTANAER